MFRGGDLLVGQPQEGCPDLDAEVLFKGEVYERVNLIGNDMEIIFIVYFIDDCKEELKRDIADRHPSSFIICLVYVEASASSGFLTFHSSLMAFVEVVEIGEGVQGELCVLSMVSLSLALRGD